jgi:hypothetical protein
MNVSHLKKRGEFRFEISSLSFNSTGSFHIELDGSQDISTQEIN